MTALLGDIATRLAGIEIVAKGEENLWAERPAVFIFNHQSNADMFILTKLLRKDVRAIAKKELLYSPVGPLFMIAGVIFIDRSNREKAIEGMKPAVKALQNGTSIAIAPEGTRSYDTTLGQFKKGAFHLAMQANVPIVPIVIKDAHSILPRGSALVRSQAVEVVVLPPIDVSNWRAEELNERIDEVRNLYLQELGQMPSDEFIEVVEG
jgi:putative phosphoserine phosphatase/1-acylglycerol-3-phosphate O-acyltransferase